MASKNNRSNLKIDKFFSPTAPGASHVGNNSNAESTAVSNEVEMRGVAEVTERTNVPLDPTQSQSLLELDLPSYPDIENLTDDDLKKDEVRIKLLQGTWDHCHQFKFPSKGIRRKQRKLNHTWLVNNKWLRYSVSRDFVWCVYCVLCCCKAHSLNLAIDHACKEPLVRNMLSTLQTITFAFDYSAKRLLAFQESLRQDVLVREGMERRAKLRTLCETRWASRADSLYTFRTAYPVLVQSLETLSEDGDGKARGYLCSIKQFDFIIALCATEHVLSNTVSLSKMLQGKNVDLIETAREASVVINVMKVERDDPSVWKELYERGKQLAADVDIEPRIPRTAGRQQHRVNIPAETPEMYWQRAVYFPLVDHLVQELADRLLSQEDHFLGQYLAPAKLNAFNSGVQGKLYETYKTDLSEKKDFDNEILRWQTKWSHSTEEKPVALTETLQHANPDLYPNVVTIITILLTMPVSTATPERSFSTMHRVKTYLRSTMKTERLSALALMHA